MAAHGGAGEVGGVRERKPLPTGVSALFVDLDGVLADFDAGVRAVLGTDWECAHPKVRWSALARVPHPGFFAGLSKMHDAEVLWAMVGPYDPVILTGVPHGGWAPGQKRAWVAEHLGPHVPVITLMARDKQLHAKPGALLIDDNEDNIDRWLHAGGIGLLHKDAASTVAALRELGFGHASARDDVTPCDGYGATVADSASSGEEDTDIR